MVIPTTPAQHGPAGGRGGECTEGGIEEDRVGEIMTERSTEVKE